MWMLTRRSTTTHTYWYDSVGNITTVRDDVKGQNSEVYWLHGDHLGSASLTTNITGAAVSEMRYYPFGETRWVSGTLPTDERLIITGLADL
jgi:hypothetical protein